MVKNYNYYPKDSNPVHQRIHDEIRRNGMAHGSPIIGLTVLRPNVSGSLSVHTQTSKRFTNRNVIWGTRIPDVATYYAAVHTVVRGQFWLPGDDPERPGRVLARASAVVPERKPGRTKGMDDIVGHKYYLSNAGKELIQWRLAQEIESEVYFGKKRDFKLVRPDSAEWRTFKTIRAVGSAAVTAAHLPFDVFELTSVNSNDVIRRINDENDRPAETRSLEEAPFADSLPLSTECVTFLS